MTEYTEGQRVVCTCGGNHRGTVTHVMDGRTVGVAWDDNTPLTNDTTFRKTHYAAGDTVSISVSRIKPDIDTKEGEHGS